jgi:hypothetical protein
VTPSTTTQTAGDPPEEDLLGEGLGGPGWEVGQEPGVGWPDVGGAGAGCVGDVPGGGDFPGVGDGPGVGTGTGVPEDCGFGPRGPGLRPAGWPGTVPGDAEEVWAPPVPPVRPGPGPGPGPPGCSVTGAPAAVCGAPEPYSTVSVSAPAATATAAVSNAQ